MSDLLEELAARADAGDVRAACLVAVEAEQCSAYLDGQSVAHLEEQFVAGVEARGLAGPELDAAVARFTATAERIGRTRERCASVPRERIRPLLPLHLRAARLGDPVAAARFLRFAEADDAALLVAHPELLGIYRREAFRLFHDQLRAGNENMAGLWRAATRPGSRFAFRGVLPPEWMDPDLAYALAHRIHAMPQPDGHEARMAAIPPQVLDQARRLHEAWFTGTQAEQTRARMKEGADPRRRCEQL